MRKALLLALFAVAIPVAASAHDCARVHHHAHAGAVPVAPVPSGGLPDVPIVTPAVNGAFGIIRAAFGAGASILTDAGQVIIGFDPFGHPVYEDRGW